LTTNAAQFRRVGATWVIRGFMGLAGEHGSCGVHGSRSLHPHAPPQDSFVGVWILPQDVLGGGVKGCVGGWGVGVNCVRDTWDMRGCIGLAVVHGSYRGY